MANKVMLSVTIDYDTLIIAKQLIPNMSKFVDESIREMCKIKLEEKKDEPTMQILLKHLKEIEAKKEHEKKEKDKPKVKIVGGNF